MAIRSTSLPAAAPTQRVRARWSVPRRDRGFVIGLLLPALVVTVLVILAPLFYTLYLSLNYAEVVVVGGRGSIETTWVGLQNYLYFLKDSGFWQSLRVTAYFTAASLVVEIGVGIGIALVLNQQFHGRRLVRLLFILPWAIPTIVNARLWNMIYEPHAYGALNGLLLQLGLIQSPVNFLSPVPLFQNVPLLGDLAAWIGATRALNWIIVGDTWKVLPVVTLLILASLQSIPPEVYEAAAVDGANAWQRFMLITLPLLRPVLVVVLVYRTMELFRVFDILYTLMAYTIPVMAIRTFQEAFVFGLFGRGAALAALIGLVILGLAVLYIKMLRTEDLQ